MNGKPDAREKDNERKRQSLVIVGALCISFTCLGSLLFGPLLFPDQAVHAWPVALHSGLKADYSADTLAMLLPAVDLNIIENAIQDQVQSTDLPERISTVISNLLTAVPTVTPQMFLSPTATRVVRQTSAPGPVYASATPNNPPSQPTAMFTSTVVASATYTATPTGTGVNPSMTVLPATPTSTPQTVVPPTSVPPSSTPVPPTTVPYPPPSTPVPPTPVPPTPIPPTVVPTVPDPPTNTPEPVITPPYPGGG